MPLLCGENPEWPWEDYLQGPVHALHVGALEKIQWLREFSDEDRPRVARSVVRLYDELMALDPAPHWRGRFMVATYRALSVVSPTDAVDFSARHLGSVPEWELTAVLRAVETAAVVAGVEATARSGLSASVRSIWERYLADRTTESLRNRPGIMALLLGLFGWCGGDLAPRIAELDDHPIGMQAFYLFCVVPPAYASEEDVYAWNNKIMVYMALHGQHFSLRRFVAEVAARRMGPGA